MGQFGPLGCRINSTLTYVIYCIRVNVLKCQCRCQCPKGNNFMLTLLQGGPRAGRRGTFLARKSAFFYATPMKPPFFRLRRSRLNGIISPPYPEVTLDNFGFPVGGRLATRRAVSWPRFPKVALLGSKNAVFWPETIFFVVSLKINCYNHDGTPKRQL